MTTRGQIWKCNVCGNVVEVLHEGADALVCCGEAMVLMRGNSMDADIEKHVPVVNGKKVSVGSVLHPMESGHYIEWVEASSDSGMAPCKKFLKPGDKPEIEFPFVIKRARAYCNLHGLWKS
ncbi:desulfoferrodoxin FeS4 iron-binding domain-containing protein [archaeon]|jgi:superoxide reductase|nr:desulfoferrodoxin FeS4 iron-binding domain-containing protein [archaeon]MBT7128301.1 desulfoferrodoxin FeS4 iron-binding domain-containing protein [archaeon]